MKKTGKTAYAHKGWAIYKSGAFGRLPKKYVLYPPDALPGERYEEPTLRRAVGFIDGRLALEAFNERMREEAEWVEVEDG